MAARQVWAGVYLLMLAGCEERLFLTLPEGTAWVSAVQEHGGVIAPSRLLPAEEGSEGLPASVRGTLTIVGFERSSLSSIMETATTEAAERATLRGLSACETPLPRPAWAYRLEETELFVPVPAESVPALTSDLFDGEQCEGRALTWEVVCGSESTACPINTERRQGCSFDSRACSFIGSSAFSAVLRSDERVCLSSTPPGCSFDIEAGPHGVLNCPTGTGGVCELHPHIDEGPRLRVVGRVRVRDVPPRAPRVSEGFVPDGTHLMLRGQGYLTDLAVLTDRLVTVGPPGYVEEHACHDGAPSLLHFISKDSGEVLFVREAPGCITAVHAALDGRSFVAALQGGARPSSIEVLLFDQDGTELSRAAADLNLRASTRIDRLSLGPDGRGGWVATAEESETEFEGGVTHLFRVERAGTSELRPDVLRRLSPPDPTRDMQLAAAVLHQGRLAFPSTSNPTGIVWLDPETLEVEQQWFTDGALTAARRPHVVHAPRASEALLATAVGNGAALLVLEDFQLARAARMFEKPESQPFAIADWTADPRYALVATFHDEPRAALFDLAQKHYVPGSVALGFGLPLSARADGDTVWVMLPWEGSLVQVGPALP